MGVKLNHSPHAYACLPSVTEESNRADVASFSGLRREWIAAKSLHLFAWWFSAYNKPRKPFYEQNMEAINIKEEARRLIDRLPENATWDDLMYEIYVRVAIEAGLADSQAGRITSVETVRQQFGLPTWRFFGQTQPSSIFPGFMPTSPKIHLNMGVEWLDRLTRRDVWTDCCVSGFGEGHKGEYREQTTPVGSFQVANPFGLFDMHGNVLEWCLDHWHDSYEGAPSDGQAWLLDEDENDNHSRLLRGGSWYLLPRNCRCAHRYWNTPDSRNYSSGFRVVCGAAWTP